MEKDQSSIDSVCEKTTGEKVAEIVSDDSLTTTQKCAGIAKVYEDRRDNQSMKLSCLETSLQNGEGIKAAQEMYAWIME